MKPEFSEDSARLEFDHVTIAYNGKPVLDDVSFEVPHGAQVAIVGPNGAGKSTLFKALVNLLPLRSGQIRIHGQSLDRHQDCVAYIPQREDVDWRFPVTVWDVVMMGRLAHYGWFGQPSKNDRRLVSEKLEEMGMAGLADRAIGELSGGQQQRVFLARALAQEPHILLMDEPFTGVDAVTQETTLKLFDALRKQQVTVLVSTHDLSLAARRFDLTALLNHRLVAFGSSEQVFTQEHISSAFHQVMYVNGAAIVDDCCGPESGDAQHHHAEEQA